MEKQAEITKYLEEGLNLYGLGKFPEAIEVWRKVLDIDPDNTLARDYIESAGGEAESPKPAPPRREPRDIRTQRGPVSPRSVPETIPTFRRGGSQPSDPHPARAFGPGSYLNEAKSLVQANDLEGALDLLEKALENEPENIEVQSFYEMVRGKQLRHYVREAGDPSYVPKILKRQNELLSFNLTKEAGFILSLVDGQITLEEVLSLSGMDKFSTYRNIIRLKRLGIIS